MNAKFILGLLIGVGAMYLYKKGVQIAPVKPNGPKPLIKPVETNVLPSTSNVQLAGCSIVYPNV